MTDEMILRRYAAEAAKDPNADRDAILTRTADALKVDLERVRVVWDDWFFSRGAG